MTSLSCVRLFVTPWTVAHQAPLSMGFSRQEYWSGLPFLSPRDLPNPGIKPGSPALQADALPSEPPGKPKVKMKVAQLCPTVCDPTDCVVHGILQARILEWVAFPFSRGSSQPRGRTQVSCIAGGFFTSWATREAQYFFKPLFLVGGGGGRILEWAAIPFSRRSSQPRDWTRVSHIVDRCFIVWATREVLCNFSLFLLLLWLSQISSCFHYILITIEISIFSI